MKTNAPRGAVAIAAVAVIAAACALGYYVALPGAPGASADASEVASAVRAALANPNELERTAALAPILASLDPRNLDAVLDAFESTFTNVGPGAVAMELLGEAWSRIDPAAALVRIQGWKPYRQNTAVPPLMRSWARRDPAAARAALEKIGPETLRESATTAVILGWADSGDPAIWEEYVAGLPFGRPAAYDLMRQLGARDGVEALMQRARDVSPDVADGFRAHALQNAAEIATRVDPERAAAFAEKHRSEAGGLEQTVAMRWAATDGPRATEWALSRPPGPARDRTVRGAVEYWLWSDRAAAIDWVRHQPEEVVAGVRDLYAVALGQIDPQQGLEVSASIPDPAERRRVQSLLARNWLSKQPAIAASWLTEHGLGDLVAENRQSAMPQAGAGPQLEQPKGEKIE